MLSKCLRSASSSFNKVNNFNKVAAVKSNLNVNQFKRYMSAAPGSKGKVVLMYSGGLDTSTILLWLIEQGYDVIAYAANLGQKEDFDAVIAKGMQSGAKKVYIEDLREDFITNYVFPAISCNAIYEDVYLMGTSLARPCIAKRAVEIAEKEGCMFVSHGATGKGNDQVRFELTVAALNPRLTTIAPWRDEAFFTKFQGRPDLVKYATEKGVPGFSLKSKPYSMDDNIMHISYESGILEDPRNGSEKDMWRMTTDPEDAPDKADNIVIDFKAGIPVRVENVGDGTVKSDPVGLFSYINTLGSKHGIGRTDIVENRFVGLKSRGCYEAPGGTILRAAHIDLEGISMDREVRRLRDILSRKFSDVCYNGFWFSPEMDFLLNAMKKSQETVEGQVEVRLYKGHTYMRGRSSPFSLYDKNLVSMDIGGGYDPRNAAGFININSIRLKAQYALRQKGLKK